MKCILALQELQMARIEMGHVQEMLQTSKEAKEPEANEMVQISCIDCLALRCL